MLWGSVPGSIFDNMESEKEIRYVTVQDMKDELFRLSAIENKTPEIKKRISDLDFWVLLCHMGKIGTVEFE